jgi:hypothetical protein
MSQLVDVRPFFSTDPVSPDEHWGPAVVRAIAHVKDVGLGGIYFPAGHYHFDPAGVNSIEIQDVDNFVIAGDGPASHLYHVPELLGGDSRFLIHIANTVNRVVVRDLTLDGGFTSPDAQPGVPGQHHLVAIGSGSRDDTTTHQIRVTNCYLKNCRGDAINVIGDTSTVSTLGVISALNEGDTVTIGDIVYRFTAVLTQSDDVLIADTADPADTVAASLDNLVMAIRLVKQDLTLPLHYHSDTIANSKVDRAERVGSNRLEVRPKAVESVFLATTLSEASWDTTVIRALTDEVQIDHNFIYDTHRTGIGIQRGCRRVIIDSNIIVPAQRGVIDFEPTGQNVDSEDWHHGNSSQQFIVTNNILVKPQRNNTVVSFSGIGSRDRNKYSIFSHNLCLGGGIEGQNVGPLIVDSNVIIGNRAAGSDGRALIDFHRGCQDLIVSNNYIERPLPEDGEAPQGYTLNLYRTDDRTQTPQNPTHHETITVGTITYRFRHGETFLHPNDVRVGADVAQTCENIEAALLAGPGSGFAYGNETLRNPGVFVVASEEKSVHVFGGSIAFPVSEDLANGSWTTPNSRAGALIRIWESGDVQPTRVNIVNNIGHQYMLQSGIVLLEVNNALVQANQLHCHFSGELGTGIEHVSSEKDSFINDQVHVRSNHIKTHGAGRWGVGIHMGKTSNLAHSSIVDNSIDGPTIGIDYIEVPRIVPTIAGNRISGNSGTAINVSIPFCIGGNFGDVSHYVGEGVPSFVAAKGSTYINRTGVQDDPTNAPRYLSNGTGMWLAIPNG